MTEHRFWQFSLAAYRREGVSSICLRLQDEMNADVNVLLFMLWLGATDRVVTDAEAMTRIIAATQGWHRAVVRPLRQARRAMKGWPVPDLQERDAVRARLQAVEIEAERIEQTMLFALSAGGEATLWSAQERNDEGEAMTANARLYLSTLDPGALGGEETDARETLVAELVALCR